ncbi:MULTISPECIES: complex I subunit 5 family protein [Halomonadaceae]|jgi:formate hydrogenlyase subunit 3/multisubunit Na+/H+ antiporter MnhD subunit|uniref:NADH:ubiquinone oxidoreductase subunit 5 (Chain L)/Multisubunit Na+/H+ antiporter, MnhA subunit n=1 Tax=Vreelandella aquamarina TaxID=77097 RepID=A0A1H8LGL2_9GAMM|nr:MULTISPECIES: proton-conducting transporter membrane subunit [Halomonas]MEC9020142.1 proton-conducting transporter membrane subunit [Pseudomonadota bacterium]MCC4287722.1 NADH-ubiquinone oxidoreductase [Halomonas meridiana]MCD1652377.1 NADH-ubiquinone oxidoreductase [Halomonas axialensis]MCD2088480.1 NADH-ubiquinone oxidoreductase [Halomonas meridiana]MDC8443538.1 NADH-ubiquinone oxidoreductase [Halomonas aquamarina]|tara:strand:- start:369 stop:1859 length:1491 start_codon:yes stop_codon:yes gene_type:complete
MIWRFGLYDNTFDPLWMTDWALAAVLLLPMVFGALGAVFRPSRLLPVALACLPILLAGGVMVLDYQQVGLLRWQWEVAGIELTLRLSGLSALMLLITQWTAAAVAVYTPGYLRLTLPNASVRWLWPLMGLLVSALSLIWLAADLLILYAALESMGLAAVGMLLLSGKSAALQAGMRYLLLALVGSLAFLLGVALLMSQWGTLDLIALEARVEPEPLTWVAAALIGAGLALKAALFPLHGWLTPVHENAWTPVSALHAALVIKASLYILMMLWGILLPETLFAPRLVAWLGMLAIVWGGLVAWRADSLKTLIASSTVGQLGYLMVAFPLVLGPNIAPLPLSLAWDGFWLHLMGHALAKAAMFMAAGNLIIATGESSLKALAGTSRRLPLSLLIFGMAAVTLMGLPPSAGFTAKWLLLQSMVLTQQWLAVAALLAGTLLTAAYVFRVFRYSFDETAPRHDYQPLAPGMDAVALCLAVAAFALGLLAHFPLGLLHGGGA